ncbi:MAG TPA: amidohydrolase family protein [Humidesulfovibrio sp.]|uniref:amidohydrolase family protein n=1 Tax=Humidesulfovibrio sp. TaxID=2910988 RepID=UPI002BD031AC|nr:amidohydrolase family protein [Humidesulfovibrio sp.]HWR03220.1 amidohydrolase family protein [Humidesulfovibrio sp.]
MPELLRAAAAAPMTPNLPPLLQDAAVVVEGEEILAVGTYAGLKAGHSGPVRDLGDVTLAPATFNSHVHLEMCHLLGLTTQGQGFVPWVKSLLAQPLYELDAARVRAELMRLEQRGAAFVADISTHNAAKVGEILASSGLGFASFREVIGNTVPGDASTLLPQVPTVEQGGRGVMSVAGHALYSTTGELLQAAKGFCRERNLPFSLHLAEHTDEDSILLRGESPFLDLLKSRGVLTSYTAPGKRPVPLARDLGLLDEGTLLVHCVTVTEADVADIAASRATVCLCPRSNEHIGVGRAPARAFLDAGVNLCLGTDGLCSNTDLDPYGEVARLLELEPRLDLFRALALVTVNPARYFGRSIPRAARLGTLAPGRLARFSIVPQAVLDICSHR